MKASQKLRVEIGDIVNIVRFDSLDPRLLPLVAKLEREGDIYGPVILGDSDLFVSIGYYGKRIGPVKPTIFGYESEELLAKQYK